MEASHSPTPGPLPQEPMGEPGDHLEVLLRTAEQDFQGALEEAAHRLHERLVELHAEVVQAVEQTLSEAKGKAERLLEEARFEAAELKAGAELPPFAHPSTSRIGQAPPAGVILEPEEAPSAPVVQPEIPLSEAAGPPPNPVGATAAPLSSPFQPTVPVQFNGSLGPPAVSSLASPQSATLSGVGGPFTTSPVAETPSPPVVPMRPPGQQGIPLPVEAASSAKVAQGLSRDHVLTAVAAKMGFPKEMLEEYLSSGVPLELTPPKVIEIFKELERLVPSAPLLDVSRLTEFSTLKALVDHLAPATCEFAAEGSVTPVPLSPPLTEPVELPKTPFHGPPLQPTLSPVERAQFKQLPHSAPESSPCVPPVVSPPPFQEAMTVTSPAGLGTGVPGAAPAAPEVPAPLEMEVPLERRVIRSQVANACGFGVAQIDRVGTLCIVPDRDQSVAKALRDLLRSEGVEAEITPALPSNARGVIVLNGLREGVEGDEGIALQAEAYQAAYALLSELGDREGIFVSVQDTGGDFGITSGKEKTWLGGSCGLARVLARVNPRLVVKSLDMECEGRSTEVLARRIFRELTEGGPEIEVGLSADGTRLTRVIETTELVDRGMPLPKAALVVVHGAGQGMLSEPLLELARRQSLRFALLGSVIYQEATEDPLRHVADPDELRSGLRQMGVPEANLELQLETILAQREIRRLKCQLQELGSSVSYHVVDSSDASALELMMSQLRAEWGDPAAVIHGSGAWGAQGQESSIEAFAARLRRDVLGWEQLLKLVQSDSLHLIGMLSPSAFVERGRSDAALAVANEVLGRLASVESGRRGPETVVRLLHWAYVDDGTLSGRTKVRLQEEGIDWVPRTQSGRVIADEWANALRGDIQVVLTPAKRSETLQGVGCFPRFAGRVERHVSKQSIPQLEDHVAEGRCLIPPIMVMEWFLRLGRQLEGGLAPGRICREFGQLEPLTLADLEKDRDSYTLVMEAPEQFQEGGETPMHLMDRRGRKHYAAILGSEKDAQDRISQLRAAPELTLERTAWTGNHVYGPGALFHGPVFQVLHRVDGISPDGALARLVPPEDAGWSRESPVFHPAMIDGVAQLAFVWGLFTQDAEFQLQSIGEFQQAQDANYDQALRCVIEGVESSRTSLRLHAYLESDGGDIIANLRDVVCEPRKRPSGG